MNAAIQVNDGFHNVELRLAEVAMSPTDDELATERFIGELVGEVIAENQHPPGYHYTSRDIMHMLTSAARKGYASGLFDGEEIGRDKGYQAALDQVAARVPR